MIRLQRARKVLPAMKITLRPTKLGTIGPINALTRLLAVMRNEPRTGEMKKLPPVDASILISRVVLKTIIGPIAHSCPVKAMKKQTHVLLQYSAPKSDSLNETLTALSL